MFVIYSFTPGVCLAYASTAPRTVPAAASVLHAIGALAKTAKIALNFNHVVGFGQWRPHRDNVGISPCRPDPEHLITFQISIALEDIEDKKQKGTSLMPDLWPLPALI